MIAISASIALICSIGSVVATIVVAVVPDILIAVGSIGGTSSCCSTLRIMLLYREGIGSSAMIDINASIDLISSTGSVVATIIMVVVLGATIAVGNTKLGGGAVLVNSLIAV